MITKNLFEKILVEPAKNNTTDLYIVSGYATAAMAFRHLELLSKKELQIKIHLIVGMCPQDGLPETNHIAFRKLAEEIYPNNFECSYVMSSTPVHSKIYSWCEEDKALSAYVGSANYTQNAFGNTQKEAMEIANPKDCREYFDLIAKDSIYCTHGEAEDFVRIYNDKEYYGRRIQKSKVTKTPKKKTDYNSLPFAKISLLDRHGELPTRSGLNWGQRPEYRRNPNQAYIRVPSEIIKSNFFPERGMDFTVLTDDGKVLICKRAQANGKAIETPHDNSLIGEYFRNRLGLPEGELVKTRDLRRYGRTNVDFYRIDDETYYMDFSK